MDWSKLRESLLPKANASVLPPRIKLPVLPSVVLQFAKLADDPNAAPRELGQLIETDATLTCELLKYANSAALASRNQLTTAQQAIARIGVRSAKMVLLAAAVQQTMKASRSKLLNIQNLWVTNLERALLAREIARKLKADADLAYCASLLQDCLLPVLSNELPDFYLKYLSQEDGQRVALVDFEQQHLGWDHTIATAQLLDVWGFSADLICCVRLHHMGLPALQDETLGRTAAAAVAVAALMPDPLRQTPTGLQQLISLDGIWPQLNLAETASRVAEGLKELTPLANQHITLERRLERETATAT